jgi:flavin-binding protein dodecin
MTIAKIMEVTADSPEGFEDAVRRGIERATKTVSHVQSAWIKDQNIVLKDGKIDQYRVKMKLTFVLKE